MSATSADSRWNHFVENPDDRASFELLEEQLFMESDWLRLADLYRRRQSAPSLADRPAERAQLGLRLGGILEERLLDAEAAIEVYTAAVQLDSSLHKALARLRRIYADRRSWEAVLQIGEQQAGLGSSGDERARVYAEMGDIWLREVGDPEQAELLYARARAEAGEPLGSEPVEPDDAVVQSAWLAAARGETDSALSSLESALERNPTSIEALDMMTTVLEGAERHQDMTALLERRASLAGDPETRSAILMRLGQLREQLGDLPEAREAYERALAAHPAHGAAREALRRVYRSTEAWGELRRLLESGVERDGGAGQVDLLCELADVLELHLGNPDAAREHLELAIDLDPQDPRPRQSLARLGVEETELTLPDLDADAPLPSEAPRGSRVAEVLERKLADWESRHEGCSPEATRLRLRIAELRAGALRDPSGAVEVLEPLLESDATLLDAAPALSGLYEQLGRQDELITLAENAARLTEPSEQRIYWYRRAAETARAVGAPERAISCYQELVANHPNDHGARAALCDLFRSRGDRESLAGLLRDEIGRAAESRELEVQLELAALADEREDAGVAGIAHLRRCLELEPQREDLLERALRAAEARGGALAQLDLVDHICACASGDKDRAALLTRRGILLADALRWEEEAADTWREALELDPDQSLAKERLSTSL